MSDGRISVFKTGQYSTGHRCYAFSIHMSVGIWVCFCTLAAVNDASGTQEFSSLLCILISLTLNMGSAAGWLPPVAFLHSFPQQGRHLTSPLRKSPHSSTSLETLAFKKNNNRKQRAMQTSHFSQCKARKTSWWCWLRLFYSTALGIFSKVAAHFWLVSAIYPCFNWCFHDSWVFLGVVNV